MRRVQESKIAKTPSKLQIFQFIDLSIFPEENMGAGVFQSLRFGNIAIWMEDFWSLEVLKSNSVHFLSSESLIATKSPRHLARRDLGRFEVPKICPDLGTLFLNLSDDTITQHMFYLVTFA